MGATAENLQQLMAFFKLEGGSQQRSSAPTKVAAKAVGTARTAAPRPQAVASASSIEQDFERF